MGGTDAESPGAVLRYLQLNLLSLLPGHEGIVESTEGLNFSLLTDLHNLGEEPYEALAVYIHNRVLMSGTDGLVNARMHFCLLQMLGTGQTISYMILQHPGYRGESNLPQSITNYEYSVTEMFKNKGRNEETREAIHTLYRMLMVLSAKPAHGPWWDTTYLAPTRADVDTYMMHLRHMLTLGAGK